MLETGQLYIPVIVGTTRPKRWSIHAVKLVHKIGVEIEQVKSELLDPQDFGIRYDGNDQENKDPEYSKITEEADGFFIVVPEYNHSFPGSLKRFLDSELENYLHKPVAFAGVSAGPWGGTRAIEALLPVVRELGMVATFEDVHFPYVQNIFNQQGELIEEKLDQDYQQMIREAYQELIWLAAVLKFGRQNIEKRV